MADDRSKQLHRDRRSGRFCKQTLEKNRLISISNLKRTSLPDSTSTAGLCISLDHCYQSVEPPEINDPQSQSTSSISNSFETINDFYFSGKLKPISSTRFVIDLQTFFDNMKCKRCDTKLHFDNAIGVLPSGLSRKLIVRCTVTH